MYNKVELCGVNTGQLPVLTEAEKRQLLTLAHAGDKAAPASAEKPKATTGDDALALLGLGDEIPL